MSFEIKKHKDDLIFIPLGGASEIGMNLNLYQYQGKWLMVDLGAGFADTYYPGVELLVAEINYISKQRDKLLGIVLTHVHEDHLGAVQYLWQELRCPIYATKFTANFLKQKMKDTDFVKDIEIIEIEERKKFQVGPFNIEPVPLTHSTPEMQALMIRTDIGNVFHTGDWKFDPDPLIGNVSDYDYLKRLGDEGVLALVGDSTNVFNETHSGSEGELRESLTNIIASCKKLVIVATFASNVARIETIVKAAESAGRKVVMAGKSLWRILEAARASGYLLDLPQIYKPEDVGKMKREKVLIISTGCQGEPLASVTKIANKTHPNIRLSPGDTVIFSSKIIPGNEKKIFRVLNQLIAQEANVLTEKDHFVHVSGHPSREELKKMYELIRPEIAIPVHGELMHLNEHAKLAKKWGISKAIQVSNGDVIHLAPNEPSIIEKVESGYLGVDGHFLLPSDSNILRMRRRLQESGIIFAVLILTERNKLITAPVIRAPGVLDKEEDKVIFNRMAKEIAKSLDSLLEGKVNQKQRTDIVENAVRTAIRKILKLDVGKNPIIDVELVYIAK